MRTISENTLALLAGKEGIESVLIVAVKWTDEGGYFWYADREIPEQNIPGKILELGSFDNVISADGNSSNTSVSVKLDDTDGTIKAIFDSHDIHKRSVVIFQWFVGMPWGEAITLHEGVLSSPIVWDEGQRTFSFEVIDKLEANEVGFSVEEGIFPFISQDLYGKPWPMVFGSVRHSQTLKLQNIPTAFTLQAFGIPDPTIPKQIAKLSAEGLMWINAGQSQAIAAAIRCSDINRVNTLVDECEEDSEVQEHKAKAEEYYLKAAEILTEQDNLRDQYREQLAWKRDGIQLASTHFINEKFEGRVKVGDLIFLARMQGHSGVLLTDPEIAKAGQIASYLDDYTINKDQYYPDVELKTKNVKTGFQFVQAGSQVEIVNDFPIRHMVSMIPGTVNSVWAYRSHNGLKRLTKLPTRYYTVETLDFGALQPVVVKLLKPLSMVNVIENERIETYENQYGARLPQHIVPQVDWEDDIYVSFTSTVGPNTVDIIEWVITNYCPGMGWDETSFDDVKAKLTNYPMNFTYTNRIEAIEFIKQLAYQARCAVWVKGSIFYIRYLSEEMTPVDTITEDDVINASMVVSGTSTESIVTKYIATFSPDYTQEGPVELTLRFNINKYGLNTQSHDYFAYNHFSLVQKSATFWMIRDSNTWKILRCKLPATKINLETFDFVTLDFDQEYVATGSVVALVQSATYNSDDHTIDVEFWIPVRLGEKIKYDFAWPATLESSVKFPPANEILPGNSGGLSEVKGTMPASNSLRHEIDNPSSGLHITYRRDEPQIQRQSISGYIPRVRPPREQVLGPDYFPSDTDDEYPTLEEPQSDEPTFEETPLFDYDYNDSTFLDPVATIVDNRMYPGHILSFKETDANGYQIYEVRIYAKAFAEQSKVIEARVMQLDEDEEIPEGTAVYVCLNAWRNPTDEDGNIDVFHDYTIQPPIWLQ